LGLHRGDRHARHPHDPIGRIREISAPEDHPRASGRVAALLRLAHQHGALTRGRQAQHLPRYLLRALLDHDERQLLHARADVLHHGDGRGPDPLLGRLPLRAQPARNEVDGGSAPEPGGPDQDSLGQLQAAVEDVAHFLLFTSFHGSFTAVPTVSISTLASLPPTLRTSRRYSFCTMSRVTGSTEIGPRGLFGSLKFFRSSMVRSGSILPFCSFTTYRMAAMPSQPPTATKLGVSLAP